MLLILHFPQKENDDTINYQVYRGYEWHANSSVAVDETKGAVLKQNGRSINTLFSARNRGMKESNLNAWGNPAVS